MKKILLFLFATAGAFNALAQNINPESDFVRHDDYVKPRHHKEKKHREKKKERREENAEVYRESRAPRMHRERVPREPRVREPRAPIRYDPLCTGWCIDANVMGGLFTQQVSTANLLSGYANSVNSRISAPQFNSGGEFGADVEAGYFFGHKKRHFGIGTGLMYFYQASNATVDNFHVEYQAYDKFGNTYRQEITNDNQVKETWHTSNFNIPLLLKYKTKFSNRVGFTADAGVLFNLSEVTSYKTNAAFDYEAVYQYQNSEGVITTTYDNAATPAAGDLLITKSQYLSTHSSANIQDYFNSLRNQGYNVGLGIKPNNNTGSVSYTAGSVGLLLRPAISIYLRDNFSLNLGVYYLLQNFSRNATATNILADKTGGYTPVLNSVSSAANNSYGINAGIRYCFCRKNCYEPMAPETDDMAAEPEVQPAPVDVQPAAPEAPAPEPENVPESHVDISTPLLFDVNKTVIKKSSYPIIQEAIKELRDDPNAYLVIHGYTDNTGTVAYNKTLSKKRAVAVKNYLRRHGVKTRTIKTEGHGEAHPRASNHTRAGRAKNRRAVIKLKENE